MKILMLLGGLLGFLIGAGFGLAQNSPWPDALWRASITAFIGGMMFRWWGRRWLECLVQVQQEKLATPAATPVSAPSTKGK